MSVTKIRTGEQAAALDGLAPGESGVILRVGNQRGAMKRRLIDMGLTPGTHVTVHKMAPFGDPIELHLRGYALSIRQEDAAQISMDVSRDAVGPQSKKGRASMLQRGLDQETLRRMRAAHAHEERMHSRPKDYMDHDTREMKIALVGNPNSGKTTLFNAFTGANQSVGNWPGVTVEKKEGKVQIDGKPVTLVDLPGIYSLSPYSMEEVIARDFIIKERPDAIINIVDATNIERNMYLTIQLLELELPMVVALNFMDEANRHGDRIDCQRLSRELGIPIIPITARSGENLEALLKTAHLQMHTGVTLEPDDLYDGYTHEIHHRVGELIHDRAYAADIPSHWASIKLLEGDALVERALQLEPSLLARVHAIAAEYESASPLGDRETLVADSRYQFIERVVGLSVRKGRSFNLPTGSDRIDRIVTHKVFAIPLFLLVMLAMFTITFGQPGAYLSGGVDTLINDWFAGYVQGLLDGAGVVGWVSRLVTEGMIGGVGGVLTFLPQIALLFLCLSLLEDSGYMARAAFIMDRLLRRFGLSGKAFIPMLMGFGCTVPAVMGARTLENEKDRRMTIMLVPFMSCSARLPVYGLMASAFFPRHQGFVVFSLYLLGLLVAVGSGLIFKRTLFKGEPAPFLMELPPYRLPTLKNTLRQVWDRVRGFLARAGTLILAMSIILWLLQNFNFRLELISDSTVSILGSLGGLIAPLLIPLGFGTWQAAVALLTGFLAKEAVVSSMRLFYGFSTLGSVGLIRAALATTFTPLSAYAFLVFVLLYVPCVAAVSTIHNEMGSAKLTLYSVGWQMLTAYLVSLLVYQAGSFVLFLAGLL